MSLPRVLLVTGLSLLLAIPQSNSASAIVDDVQLYNSALSLQETHQLAGATQTPSPPPPSPRPAPATGPLRVLTSNRRYFTDGSGRAVYLTGSHVWNNFQEGGEPPPPSSLDYTGYLDFLQANNHNFIRLWVWESPRAVSRTGVQSSRSPMPFRRTGPGTGADGGLRFDLSQFDQTYFDRLRSRVIAARDRGIYVGVMLFEGFDVWNKKAGRQVWVYHPFRHNNNVNGIDGDTNGDGEGEEIQSMSVPTARARQEAYIRKVIDRVNDLDNVVYEISNESEASSVDWQNHMVNYINRYQATKPKQHPVGVTDFIRIDNSVLFAGPGHWISPGLTVFSAQDVYSINPPATMGSKVEILDSDHTWNNAAGTWGAPSTRADRVWVWKSFTRGYNPIYMDPIDLSQSNDIWASLQVNAGPILSARAVMGHTRSYATRMNLAAMTPQGTLTSTGYALASAGNEYLVYQPGSGSFTLSLSGTSGSFRIEWFNPARGTTSTGASVTGGGTRALTPPFSGDAVVYLRRQRH